MARQIKDGRNMRFVLDEKGRLTGYLDETDQEQPFVIVYAEELDGDTPENVLMRKASRAVQGEAQTNLPSSAADRITSLREAAHFLRQATLGGGTWTEIQRVFELGSRRAWLLEQIYTPETGREFPAWTGDDESVEAGGWYWEIARRLRSPRNRATSGQNPNFIFPGPKFTQRMLLTALLGNASESPNRIFYAPSESVRIKAGYVLSKFIPCSTSGGAWDSIDKAMPIMSWYGMLHRYAFRNYADLLEAVTYHPAMSRMLTYAANAKFDGTTHPDENYAREIMQLFTLGLYEMNMDGSYKLDAGGRRIYTYNQNDIQEMAKVFTGLCRWDRPDVNYTWDVESERNQMRRTDLIGIETFAYNDGIPQGYYTNSTYQVVAPGVGARLRHYIPFYEDGAKVALGGRVNIPAGTEPRQNIRMAIEALVNHPNCAPFVAKNLIKHMVTSNPSPGYVTRVARAFEDDGTGVRGNLAAVWEAILTDPEAANTIYTSRTHGRVRDGFEMFAATVRPFYRESAIPTTADDPAATATNNAVWLDDVHQTTTVRGLVMESVSLSTWGVWPAYSPSIFGPYPPEYTTAPAAGWNLVVPELGAWSASIAMDASNRLRMMAVDREPRDADGEYNVKCPSYSLMLPTTGTPAELVERLNLLMAGGTLAPSKAADISSFITGMATGTDTQIQDRIGRALSAIGFATETWVM